MRRGSILALICLAAVAGGCGGSSRAVRRATVTTLGQSPVPPRRSHSRRQAARVRNAVPQASWRPHPGAVPILVYHQLGSPPASEPYPGLYVSDANFRAEMHWLYRHGYQAVTLDEVMSAWYRGGRLPARPIVITFDNGYVAQATFAPAVLSRYGWPGVLNEITANHLAGWRLRRLIAIGWEIDSHSVSHPDLTTLPPNELRYQVVGSRRFLQRTFHIPVDSFCYPSNRYDAAVIAAVKAAGYSNALTENPGYASRNDPYLLDRFEIEDGVTQLAADLAHG
jgi:peptidoglycan/xylan/chitin deacetylase (PgdA/CDA1 family)